MELHAARGFPPRYFQLRVTLMRGLVRLLLVKTPSKDGLAPWRRFHVQDPLPPPLRTCVFFNIRSIYLHPTQNTYCTPYTLSMFAHPAHVLLSATSQGKETRTPG